MVACALESRRRAAHRGWIRPDDLELAAPPRIARGLEAIGACSSRPSTRCCGTAPRVAASSASTHLLEIFKPAPRRIYGYYCLSVLAGEHLVGRVDLKADRRQGVLRVLSAHFENAGSAIAKRDRHVARIAVARYASALRLRPKW